jgi:DNA-directed RNA polymerase subunit beta
LTALKEDEHCVTDFLIPHDEKGKITVKEYYSRFRGEEKLVDIAEIDYVNISPKQVLSISTGLIPFIESDEGHRAEMGSNMQRQAVPLLIPHAPSVGTGEEYRIAHDSLVGVIAADDGTVEYVDASKIIINGVVYNLDTFIKTNQNTCNCHTPIVCVGDKITANQLIADGGAMNNGELALGQNILIAFLS